MSNLLILLDFGLLILHSLLSLHPSHLGALGVRFVLFLDFVCIKVLLLVSLLVLVAGSVVLGVLLGVELSAVLHRALGLFVHGLLVAIRNR